MYSYEQMKPKLLTDEGQRMVLKALRGIRGAIEVAGVVQMEKAMSMAGCGDSWLQMAVVDHLVRLGEIREVKQDADIAGQHRIFTKP